MRITDLPEHVQDRQNEVHSLIAMTYDLKGKPMHSTSSCLRPEFLQIVGHAVGRIFQFVFTRREAQESRGKEQGRICRYFRAMLESGRWAVSSAVEHPVYTGKVVRSNRTSPTSESCPNAGT